MSALEGNAVEVTTRRWVERAGDLAARLGLGADGGAVERVRDRSDQRARIGMTRTPKISCQPPCSTMRPRYITATRSLTCSTTPRSWLDRDVGQPQLVLELEQAD